MGFFDDISASVEDQVGSVWDNIQNNPIGAGASVPLPDLSTLYSGTVAAAGNLTPGQIAAGASGAVQAIRPPSTPAPAPKKPASPAKAAGLGAGMLLALAAGAYFLLK